MCNGEPNAFLLDFSNVNYHNSRFFDAPVISSFIDLNVLLKCESLKIFPVGNIFVKALIYLRRSLNII